MTDIQVATSGTIDRSDRCGNCGEPMLYCVYPDGSIAYSFCGLSECVAFLLEVEIG